MNLRNLKGYLVVFALCVAGIGAWLALDASDHDDGENDNKSRALNLTDVYAFREDSQTGNSADSGNLILLVNTHDRALARQQYFYSTNARYEVHVTRVFGRDSAVKGVGDIVFRLEYGNPFNNQQEVTLTILKDGLEQVFTETSSGNPIVTTSLEDSTDNANLIVNTITSDGEDIELFTGPRQDPFFFDVDWFFQIRAFALGTGDQPSPLFRSPQEAVDFTTGYNVQTIALKVPISFLQTSGAEEIFDVWATISIRRLDV